MESFVLHVTKISAKEAKGIVNNSFTRNHNLSSRYMAVSSMHLFLTQHKSLKLQVISRMTRATKVETKSQCTRMVSTLETLDTLGWWKSLATSTNTRIML